MRGLHDGVLNAFGFENFHVYLATRDEGGKYGARSRTGGMATNVLRDVIQERGLPYDIDEGGAVFYGPKIDVKMIDALGREWQCTTIQFDFNLPERFDVNYIAEDGREHRPYMVHRALLARWSGSSGCLSSTTPGRFRGGWPPFRRWSSRRRPAPGLRERGGPADESSPACAWKSTTGTSGCRPRYATPNCRRCRTCWWQEIGEAEAKAAAVRLRSGEGPEGTPGHADHRANAEGDQGASVRCRPTIAAASGSAWTASTRERRRKRTRRPVLPLPPLETDRGFRKYPPLPVLRCSGYEAKAESADATRDI